MKHTQFPTKYRIIICLQLLVLTNLIAQTNAFNFNLNTLVDAQMKIAYFPTNTTSTSANSSLEINKRYVPSLAYLRFTSTAHFHFFEIPSVSFNYHNQSTKVTTPDRTYISNGEEKLNISIVARYSYNIKVGTNERFQPFIGFGISPQFQRTVMEPKVSSFKSSTTDFGGDFELIGSALIRLSDKVKFNLSLPINVFNYTYERTRTDSPLIPQKDQAQAHFKKEFFPLRFELKMGIIYILSKKEDRP